MSLVIGVVEHLSDSAQTPEVFVAETVAGVRRAFADWLTPYLPIDGPVSHIEYIDHEWMVENPLPDLDDEPAVAAWLSTFKDTTTDAWLTLYGTGSSREDGEPFTDVRTGVRFNLSLDQCSALSSSFTSADRGREDFEYLVSLNGGDYDEASIVTVRARHVQEVAVEAYIVEQIEAQVVTP